LDPIIVTLREMAQLLEANGSPGQAAYLAALATVGEWDQDAMVPGLRSGAVWGGMGSVCDVGGFSSMKGKHLFWKQLVRLAQEMQFAGLKCHRAECVASVLQRWLADGL
jgi:hypothetical protein